MDLNDDLTDLPETIIPWKLILLTLVGLQIHLGLGALLGLNTFQWGRGMPHPISFLINGAFLVFMIHAVLVWPITTLALPAIDRSKNEFLKIGALTLLLSPPLLSYSYYIGKVKDKYDVIEMFLVVLPAVLIGTTLFLKTRKAWLLTLAVISEAGFSWFICNEILGPWDTAIRAVSTGQGFLWIRVLLPTVVTLASLAYLRLTTVKG